MENIELPQQPQESIEKLANTKDILAYVAEKFPLCFSLSGEAKPLKVKILDDLAEALKDDPKVSKTQLRHFLRAYTTNWRYLHACREGAVRVDLEGNPCGVLEEEHVNFAAQQLAESKEAFQKRQAEKRKAERKEKFAQKGKKNPKVGAGKNFRKPRSKTVLGEVLTQDAMQTLTKGQAIKVKAGDQLTVATIVEITKDHARVQLANGLTIDVTADRLFA